MNQNDEDGVTEWDEVSFGASEDLSEPEFSSLTWDDEIVRETHREISIRARRASSLGLFED